ncbi:uncharacterized protein HaLaN_04120, partial [Haematococcus lacustris]
MEQCAACYYNHDINAGSEWEPDPQGGPQELQGLAAARAAAALQLGQQGWEQLLRRLTAVHDQACQQPPPLGLEGLPGKAGSQGQVSTASGGPLVEAAGPEWQHTSKTRGGTSATLGGTLVEVGAGKAGLACMVGGSVAARQACGVSAVLLMDNRAGFQAKADRWMRDLPLQRLTLDLKDFAIWRAPLVAASPP